MIDLLQVCGALLLVGIITYLSYKTIAYAQRNLRSLIQTNRRRVPIRGVLVVIAGMTGVVLASVTLKVSPNESIVGIPLPWAIWDKSNTSWQDS